MNARYGWGYTRTLNTGRTVVYPAATEQVARQFAAMRHNEHPVRRDLGPWQHLDGTPVTEGPQ